jgi:hypothetical protein
LAVSGIGAARRPASPCVPRACPQRVFGLRGFRPVSAGFPDVIGRIMTHAVMAAAYTASGRRPASWNLGGRGTGEDSACAGSSASPL